MGRTESIIGWVDSQPEWVGDALRRHASSPQYILSDADKLAIRSAVRRAAGMPVDEVPDHQAITAGHLGAKQNDVRRAVIASLGPVNNLARLLPDQQLSFALNGITLVYGDNGSGKSGYCRITKKLGRSLSTDDLLGNVFEPGAKPRPSVLVRYMFEGDEEPTELLWTDGDDLPEALSGMSVFDSRNARLYVDKENRIGFLPSELSMLERHGAHRREMEGTFADERALLDKRLSVPLPGGFAKGGKAELLVARMRKDDDDLPSYEELEAAANWTERDREELDQLEASLTEDPAILEGRFVRVLAALQSASTAIGTLATSLSDEVEASVNSLLVALDAAEKAVELAAQDAFGSEPIQGAGNSPWRVLYDSAKAFVASVGLGSELPSRPGDPCALCQQPLSDEASARFHRFQHFVANQASEVYKSRVGDVGSLRSRLTSLVVPEEGTTQLALAEYAAMGVDRTTVVDHVLVYFAGASSRKEALLAVLGQQVGVVVPAMPNSPAAELEREITAISGDLSDLRAAINSDTVRPATVARIGELRDIQLFANSKETFVERLSDLLTYGRLQKCSTLVGTLPLSLFITSLRRDAVTKDLADRIRNEIAGLELAHIPFEVSDRSKDGQSYFAVGLDAAVPAPNDKILSEGEQRALALACFLAEVDGDERKNALVVDDPVSSLDHIRIRRVAERLVREATGGKQVIIFTHNLLFYNEVLTAAAAIVPQVPVARRVISKSQVGFGIISADAEPWSTRKVASRVTDLQGRLTGLAKEPPVDQEQYRRIAKDFYTDLRETWERLVEELLLGKVVERYSPDVRTQSLKGVIVEDADYQTVYFAMARASERSGHDQPAAKQVGVPTIEDMKADLAALDTYRLALAKRRNKVEEARKKLEEPPQAKTA